MNHYTALPFLTPSEQATFTRIVNMLRARQYEAVYAAAPWERPEHSEHIHSVAHRSGPLARVLRIARSV